MKSHYMQTAGLLLAGTAAFGQPGTETVHELDPYTVISTMRTEKPLAVIPQTVTLIDTAAWTEQAAFSLDPISGLSQLVPSYSPSRQKITGFGETFRGRSPLFMIDGIPQSNPLRDGSRDGYTIDSVMVERVEVIHGASAAQGMGATGGIINFITLGLPESDGHRGTFSAGTEFSDELTSEGTGYFAEATSRLRSGPLAYALGASYKWRPMSYDGDGNLVGIDNTQGDTMNSASTDLFGKLQYRLSADQWVQAMVNRFTIEQDLEYVPVPGDPARDIPTGSVEGETPGKPTQNEVTSFNLTYRDGSVMDGSLQMDLFLQDFAATYGGGTFGVFQFNGEPVFDQSQNESAKRGLKLTYARDLPELWDLGLVTGLDYLEDETRQVLVQTGRVWVPETTYAGLSPYLQLEKALGDWVFSGGVRYEDAELEVDDFTTLEAYGSQAVSGGNPGFQEWLFNLGMTWEARPGLHAFASYSQGFGMPDVGRVLRGIDEPGLDVDDFLDLQPVVTDNFEIGLRRASDQWSGTLSLFYSTSDLGSRLSADADGIFSVNREKTATYGLEGTALYRLDRQHRLELRFAAVEGKSDRDGDGDLDTRLDGSNIPPIRLNLGWNADWTGQLSTRLQSSTYFDRGDPRNVAANDFNGYTLLDLLVRLRLPRGELLAGISNLLDRQYLTYYSQTNPSPGRTFAGRGRTLNLRYKIDF